MLNVFRRSLIPIRSVSIPLQRMASSAAGAGIPTQKEQNAPINDKGAKQLLKGERVAMRLWEADKGSSTDDSSKDRLYKAHHESVGYCLEGKAELILEGQKLVIEPGQSWLVPPNAGHTYKVLQGPFRAIEATADPATL